MKSYFSISTQFDNVGDALINRELINLASLNSKVVLDLSRCDTAFSLQLLNGIQGQFEISRFGSLGLFLSLIASRAKGVDCFYYISPGGYFGELSHRDYLLKSLRYLFLLLLSVIGVKVCHVGVSYERLGPRFLKLIKFRNRFLYSHLVRDKRSLEYISKNGVSVTGTIPDLAFGIFNRVERNVEGNGIVISLRGDQAPDQVEKAKGFLIALDKISPDDLSFNFYTQVERDYFVNKLLCDFCLENLGRKAICYPVQNDIEEALRLLATNKFAISNRLHVVLMASSVGVSVNGVYYENYNQKLQGLLAEFGIAQEDMYSLNQDFSIASEFITFSLLERGIEEKRKLESIIKLVYSPTV